MSFNKNNNKFVSYLIILVTFFVLILVTKNEIVSLQENIDLKDNYKVELDGKIDKLKEINKKKNKLDKSSVDVDKYELKIKEDEIIDYIYSYIEETNRKNGLVLIKSLSISDSKKTEIGFNETSINLSLLVPNEEKLKMILSFLTSSKSKYNFFIDSFNYPYGKEVGNYDITIPLKVLYK